MTVLPVLETERLRIRPFVSDDVAHVHKLFQDIGWLDPRLTDDEQWAHNGRYVAWNTLNHQALADLYQPPTGDRVIERRETGEFVGLCGVVGIWGPFGVLPALGGQADGFSWPEVGLFWAVSPAQQGSGYASEAARALIEALFARFNLQRILAVTETENHASRRVMEKVGMRIEVNPFPEPPWLQVVGIIYHPKGQP